MKTTLKKLTVFALALLLPAIAYAAVTGLPSRPNFQSMSVNKNMGNTANACFILKRPPGASQRTNIAALCDPSLSQFRIHEGSLQIIGERTTNAHLFNMGSNSDLNATTARMDGVGGNNVLLEMAWSRCDLGDNNDCYNRWQFRLPGIVESGGDVGSDYAIIPIADSGTGSPATYPAQADAYMTSLGSAAFALRRYDASTHLAGSLVGHKACATGWTRIGPNYCGRNATATLLSGTTCTDVGTALTDATGRDYLLDVQITSANAIAARGVTVAFYTDSGCTANIESRAFSAYEFAAVADGTLIWRAETSLRTSRDHRYAKLTADTGGTSTGVLVYRSGYFD